VTPELVAQSLWSLVPVASRARYIRRAAVAMLDELDDLARVLAEATGWPRSHVVLSELLPAARGLHALAEQGPRALADQRVIPRAAWLAGRSTRLVRSPVGVVGVRGPSASPWCEPVLETAASLLAGNAVLLAAGAAGRVRGVFLRAGVPGELVTVIGAGTRGDGEAAAGRPGARGDGEATAGGPGVRGDGGVAAGGVPTTGETGADDWSADLEARCHRVVDLPPANRLGTVLVLEGAPREQVVEAALWAAFGGHATAAGRLVTVEGAVPGLLAVLEQAAAQLVETIGPPEVVVTGPDDPRFLAPTGSTLAVVEAPDADSAVRLASRAGHAPISVWARDRAKGERVARRLPSPATWVGHYGEERPNVEARLARHAMLRQLEWRAPWAPQVPHDVATRVALSELRHGRESRRWPALRALARASRRNR
jgi:hypothetical protein